MALRKRYPNGAIRKLFLSMKEGDIKTLSSDDYKIGTLRTRAGELNMEAGYTRYSVKNNPLLQNINIACFAK